MAGFIRLDVNDGVGVIRIDRPPANAIDLQVGVELQETIREANERPDVGALVLWGGPRLFAAGADIKAMAGFGADEERPSVEALGVAEVVRPAAEVFDAAVADARRLARGPREALAAAKRAIAAASEGGPEGFRLERELFLGLFGTADQREGMRAFLDKREPRFGSDTS